MLFSTQDTSSADHALIGDDRASFNIYDEVDDHVKPPPKEQSLDTLSESGSSSRNQKEAEASPSGLAKFRQASQKVRLKAKEKTNNILHPSTAKNAAHNPPVAPDLAPAPSNETDEDRLFHEAPEHKSIQAKDLLQHPVATVQSALHGASGAKMANVLDNQVIAHGANVNLVRAHDRVASAEGKEKEAALSNLEDLRKARQDTYVRWTMDRHVLKVRRVPLHNLSPPQKEDYTKVEGMRKGQMHWASYGQDLAHFYARKYGDQYIDESPDLPPATEEAINTSLERLLMTSMPYQVALMKIRQIYCWDNPVETGLWFGVYILFWLLGQLGGAALLLMIGLVIRRRLYPPTLGDLREGIRRSEDIDQMATNMTQLIEQNGSRGWIDAMIKDMGPRALLQIEDMADTLEIMRNFYEWRSPHETLISLFLFSLGWLYISTVPLWLLVKMAQLGAAAMFFGTFPIASRLPHYRILVSPLTWLFWKIPTDAEWAIARLQVESKHRKDTLSSKITRNSEGHRALFSEEASKINSGGEPLLNMGKFHCTVHNHHGYLYLTSEDVRYVTAVRLNELWKLRYDAMKTIKKARFGDQLIFVMMDDTEYIIMKLKEANEVFTQIIGYSGLVWQVTG